MNKYIIRSKSGGTKTVSLTPLKAIRYQCLECVCWAPSEVKKCTSRYCPLYLYRFGTNPERKGIGGKSSSKQVA